MSIALSRPWLAAVLCAFAPLSWAWAQPKSEPAPRPDAPPEVRPAPEAPAAPAQPEDLPAVTRDDDHGDSSPEQRREERRRKRRARGKGGDVSMGQTVRVEAGETNTDEIVVMGGSARVDGRQQGDVVVIGGNARISGEVEGNVVVIGGVLELTDTAQIDGDAVSVGGRMKKEAGAVITGQTVDMGVLGFVPGFSPEWMERGFGLGSLFVMSAFAWVKTAAAALLLAVLIAVVMPARVEAAGVVMRERWLECIAVGLATLVGSIVMTFVLCITCVGAIVPFVFYQAARYFGMAALFVIVGQALGRAAFSRDLSPLPSLLMGFLVLALLGLFIPFMWWVYSWIAVGCAVLTKFGAMQPWFRRSTPPPVPPVIPPPAPAGDALV